MTNPHYVLQGKHIAILADTGVEQSEFEHPRRALENAGATTDLVSPQDHHILAWQHDNWGSSFLVDVPLKNAQPQQYDALVLPGGVINADKLRMNHDAIDFVRHFADSGKPIAAICHAPWLLIEAGAVGGRTLTSWPSLQSDLTNAGADWVDREVAVDEGLITSRKPEDIPVFADKMIEQFAQSDHPTSTHADTNRPYTTIGPITVPKFGSATSGGGEIESNLPKN